MEEQLKNEIIIHCQKEFPNEACGFILEVVGEQQWFPCKNNDHNPVDYFTISAQDFIKAESIGKIVAVVHSHTLHPSVFSDTDVAMQKKQGIPWLLVGLKNGEPEFVWMNNQKVDLKLYGRTYTWGVNDCYSFIRDYYQEVVGIEIPDYDRPERFWERGEDLYRKHFADAGFVEVQDVKEHDVFIISLGGTSIPSHGAIYLGGNAIGHHLPSRLSCKEVYGRFYQSRTVLRLRHKDLV